MTSTYSIIIYAYILQKLFTTVFVFWKCFCVGSNSALSCRSPWQTKWWLLASTVNTYYSWYVDVFNAYHISVCVLIHFYHRYSLTTTATTTTEQELNKVENGDVEIWSCNIYKSQKNQKSKGFSFLYPLSLHERNIHKLQSYEHWLLSPVNLQICAELVFFNNNCIAHIFDKCAKRGKNDLKKSMFSYHIDGN